MSRRLRLQFVLKALSGLTQISPNARVVAKNGKRRRKRLQFAVKVLSDLQCFGGGQVDMSRRLRLQFVLKALSGLTQISPNARVVAKNGKRRRKRLQFAVKVLSDLQCFGGGQVDMSRRLRLQFVLKALSGLTQISPNARVAELVDARDLKSLDGNIVPVQVRPRVPYISQPLNSREYPGDTINNNYKRHPVRF